MQEKVDVFRSKFGFYPPRNFFHSLRIFPPIKDLYFISDGEAVKIGIANDVGSRLKGLQSANPRNLELLAYCEYGEKLEPHYHQKFKDYRIRGEWFKLSPAILEEIEFLNEDTQKNTATFNAQTKVIHKIFNRQPNSDSHPSLQTRLQY